MGDDRLTIVLRGQLKEDFEELKDKPFFEGKANTEIFEHILSYYRRTSPYINLTGE